MAGSMNGIIIELRGNPSELRKELEKIEITAGNLNKKLENGETEWSKLGGSAEKFGIKIDKVGTKVSDLGNKLSKNVTTPMLKGLGDMLETAGDLMSVFGTLSTGVGTLTSTIGLMKTGIGNATGAAADLAKGLQFAFSPTGLVVGAVTAGIGIIFSKMKEAQQEKKIKEEEAKRAAQEAIDAIDSEKQAVEEFRNSINSDLQVELEHIDRTETLWKELQKITDENGKIKDGYQDRAKVITGELSKALDTEIKLTDNVIDNYKEIQKEIDNLILKKKGEAILNISKEKNDNALKSKDKATKELIESEARIKEAKKKERDKFGQYEYWQNVVNNPTKSFGILYYVHRSEMKQAKEDWEQAKADLEKEQKICEGKSNILKGYIADMEDYDYNQQLFLQGTEEAYEEMERNFLEKSADNYKDRILIQKKTLDFAKEKSEEAKNDYNKIEEEKSQKTMEETKNKLEIIANGLKNETKMRITNNQDLSQDIKEGWKTLATESLEIYNEEVSKLPIMTQQKIEEITGVAVTKAPEIESVMEYLGKVGINALEMNEEFRSKALESLENYINGLSDTEKREVLNLIGVQNVEEVIKGLSEGNLSEEAGIKVLENFDKGLRNEAIQNMLKGSATTLANKLSGILTIQPMVKAGILGIQIAKGNIPGHKLGLDYVPYDNYIARLHKGERILTAKENEQLIKFEKMPKVIDNTLLINNQMRTMENKVICTTPNITFNVQKMDKANLDMAFNYINKRFGTQY